MGQWSKGILLYFTFSIPRLILSKIIHPPYNCAQLLSIFNGVSDKVFIFTMVFYISVKVIQRIMMFISIINIIPFR